MCDVCSVWTVTGRKLGYSLRRRLLSRNLLFCTYFWAKISHFSLFCRQSFIWTLLQYILTGTPLWLDKSEVWVILAQLSVTLYRSPGLFMDVNQNIFLDGDCFHNRQKPAMLSLAQVLLLTLHLNLETIIPYHSVDYHWTIWTQWSHCSKTCLSEGDQQSGTKTRKRFCSPAINGGKECPDRRFELGPHGNSSKYFETKECTPPDCTFYYPGPWLGWSPCSHTCGKVSSSLWWSLIFGCSLNINKSQCSQF